MKRMTCLCLIALFLFIFWGNYNLEETNKDWISDVQRTIIARNLTRGDNIRIAIIDSGINWKFEQSSNNLSFLNEMDTKDLIDHGTPIYNIIKGIANNSNIFCLKVINKCGIASMKLLEKALAWCFENDIDIINISLSYSIYDENVDVVINSLLEKGAIIVSSINNNTVNIDYPAIYDEVIAVGYTENSLSYNDNRSVFFDEPYTIDSISNDGSFKTYSGNSFLAPLVTGIIGCIISGNKTIMKEGNSIEQLVSQTKAILFPNDLN